MQPGDTSDDEITYIYDLLSELADLAMAQGDRMLARQIAMAWLHAWEVECKLAMKQCGQKVDSLLNCILLTSAVAF